MPERKSLHEGRVGRHKISYCTESEAFVVGIGSVGAIGVGGVISSRVEETIVGVIGCRMSSENGGTHGSPFASQRASKHHKENLP